MHRRYTHGTHCNPALDAIATIWHRNLYIVYVCLLLLLPELSKLFHSFVITAHTSHSTLWRASFIACADRRDRRTDRRTDVPARARQMFRGIRNTEFKLRLWGRVVYSNGADLDDDCDCYKEREREGERVGLKSIDYMRQPDIQTDRQTESLRVSSM